jgi:hypothetical protein
MVHKKRVCKERQQSQLIDCPLTAYLYSTKCIIVEQIIGKNAILKNIAGLVFKLLESNCLSSMGIG